MVAASGTHTEKWQGRSCCGVAQSDDNPSFTWVCGAAVSLKRDGPTQQNINNTLGRPHDRLSSQRSQVLAG